MSWTAIVPIKPAATRKTRLADRLAPAERARLSEAMLAHVAAIATGHPAIGRTLLLAAVPPQAGGLGWLPDHGRGLNAELDVAAAAVAGSVLILHADLPLLAADDLDALLAGAAAMTLAPDRHDRGTNAVALRGPGRVPMAFGAGSLARFRGSAPDAAIVRRPGLALDVDTAGDLARAEAGGFRW